MGKLYEVNLSERKIESSSKMSNRSRDYIDESGKFIGCFSPLADRLSDAYRIYAYVFEVFIALLAVGGLIWWFRRSWHPRLAVRGNKFVSMITFSALVYGVGFHQFFHLGEDTRINVCVLTVLTGGLCTVCFAPMFFMGLVLKKKADYNNEIAKAINGKYFSESQKGSSLDIDRLEYCRLEAKNAPAQALKYLVIYLTLLLCTIAVVVYAFCLRGDGECYFMVDEWSRPHLFWFLTIVTLQIGLSWNKIDSSMMRHSWGLRHQVERMRYYVLPLFLFNLWGVLDEVAGNFLDPYSTQEVVFTQFIGIDVGALLVVILNIHYQVYRTYDGLTKEKLDKMSHEGMTIDEVLGDETAKKAFTKFLIAIHSSENIAFHQALENFYDRQEVDPRFDAGKSAKVIFDRFIVVGAPLQVNIGHLTREEIEKKMAIRNLRPEDYSRLFDLAMDEIKHVLGGFCLIEFKKTEEYAVLVTRNVNLKNIGPAGLL